MRTVTRQIDNFFRFLFHIINYWPIFATNSHDSYARILFHAPPRNCYNDHDPLGGYVIFSRPQAFIAFFATIRCALFNINTFLQQPIPFEGMGYTKGS
jgi:hypothetical protein